MYQVPVRENVVLLYRENSALSGSHAIFMIPKARIWVNWVWVESGFNHKGVLTKISSLRLRRIGIWYENFIKLFRVWVNSFRMMTTSVFYVRGRTSDARVNKRYRNNQFGKYFCQVSIGAAILGDDLFK
ncbi:hypothetical protein GZ78_08330 [Endozoicomonas numazuensis]|uniref:Uncharacterized protein n=1 Tax=Endozoicomonas numazuensis TaxID=1137799 RepID=A0A081NGW8_9GAMM|nr:hypothetical protein GZ78_08330 [Endozoicomonas numazuensis]